MEDFGRFWKVLNTIPPLPPAKREAGARGIPTGQRMAGFVMFWTVLTITPPSIERVRDRKRGGKKE